MFCQKKSVKLRQGDSKSVSAFKTEETTEWHTLGVTLCSQSGGKLASGCTATLLDGRPMLRKSLFANEDALDQFLWWSREAFQSEAAPFPLNLDVAIKMSCIHDYMQKKWSLHVISCFKIFAIPNQTTASRLRMRVVIWTLSFDTVNRETAMLSIIYPE